MPKPGSLFLIPTPLAAETALPLPQQELERIKHLRFFVAERAKTARAHLKQYGFNLPNIEVIELNKHDNNDTEAFDKAKTELLQGTDVGFLSEAGCPGIADPGAKLVALAHQSNIPVEPLIGPSSILLSLMASGFNGQQFRFIGYLPSEKNQCKQELLKLQQLAQKNETQIFIETPYRNKQLIAELLKSLAPDLKLCIAYNLHGSNQFIKTQTIQQWQKSATTIPDEKQPCIFLLGS